MFEDKLPELFEVIIYHLLIKIQIAKQEGISISQIEDNDTDIQENIPIFEFTSLINSGHNQIKNIESQTNKLISINNKLINCSKNEEKGLFQQIYKVTDNISQSRNKISQIIKNLEVELDSSSEGNDDKKVKKEETELRIEKNLFNSMIRKYQNVISRYQNIENKIKNEKKTKLIREAETLAHRELNEEEKHNLIENPQYLQDMYKEKLAGNELQNALRDLEERHKDIKNVLKSVMELHKMVIELNALVQYQGKMIDNIVENVNKAKKYIIKGEVQITKAKKCRELCRKIKLKITISIVIILIIILSPIFIAILK